MDAKPLVSVIMAAYNSQEFISDAIESILNQTLRRFELIIVDDCSVDNTSKIIDKFRRHDKRIHVIRNHRNLGPPESRNKGLCIADGKYIAILDSDDISLPERLKIQYEYIESNKGLFLVGSGTFNIDKDGKKIKTSSPVSDEQKLKKILLKKNSICHSTIFFKNEKKKVYRNKFLYSQDYDFYLRLITDGKRFVNIARPLVKYRVSSKSLSFSQRAVQKLFANKALEFYYQREKLGFDNYSNFDNTKFLSINPLDTENTAIIREEIKKDFLFGDLDDVKKLYKKYFFLKRKIDKMFFYYLLSFTNNKSINYLRKLRICDQVSDTQLKKM